VTVVSTAIATAHASPAKTAMATACGSTVACAQHAATTAPPAGARTTNGCGSDGSRPTRWTRRASAAQANTTSGRRATSATAPRSPMAGAKTPATMPAPSMTAVARSAPRTEALRGGADGADEATDETVLRRAAGSEGPTEIGGENSDAS